MLVDERAQLKSPPSDLELHSHSDQNRPLTGVNRDGPPTYRSPWTVRLFWPWAAGPPPSSTVPAPGGQPLRRGSLQMWGQQPVSGRAPRGLPGHRFPAHSGPPAEGSCRRPRAEPAGSHFRLLPWFHATSGDRFSRLEIWTIPDGDCPLFPS